VITKAEWIESAGGPLLLAPRSSLKVWCGSERGNDPQSDYARAYAIDEEIGTISIGEKSALVLGDEPDRTTLMPRLDLGDVYIVSSTNINSILASGLAAYTTDRQVMVYYDNTSGCAGIFIANGGFSGQCP
jgi:hypothetical protein